MYSNAFVFIKTPCLISIILLREETFDELDFFFSKLMLFNTPQKKINI